MENAADALKIAFAIFVFVTAITITFSLISQAKSTADYILFYTDETNFYEHLSSSEDNRIVSVAEVISSLHRYCDESIGITIKIGNATYPFDLGNREYWNENKTIVIGGKEEFDKEANLASFIEEKILPIGYDKTFKEQFVEVPFSGIYQTGTDDTEIVLSSGGKKVYITYTLDN